MCCHGQDGASETPGSLLKHSWLDPTRVPDSVGLEWGPDICISSETPGDTDALTPGSRGRDHCLGEMVKLAKIRSLLLRTEKKKKKKLPLGLLSLPLFELKEYHSYAQKCLSRQLSVIWGRHMGSEAVILCQLSLCLQLAIVSYWHSGYSVTHILNDKHIRAIH